MLTEQRFISSLAMHIDIGAISYTFLRIELNNTQMLLTTSPKLAEFKPPERATVGINTVRDTKSLFRHGCVMLPIFRFQIG